LVKKEKNDMDKELLNKLDKQFGLSNVRQQRANLAFVSVDKEKVLPLATHLKTSEGYVHMVLLTAVDWKEEGEFQLTYILNHPGRKHDLGIRTRIDRDKAEMESIHHLWKQAATYQRELKEMFGITFPGSPGLDEAFFLEGWDNMPPMRREFDTKQYSEDTYFSRPGRATKDPASHMKDKLYPDE
jgi:NADH-quinone oxidoreductase subunit C